MALHLDGIQYDNASFDTSATTGGWSTFFRLGDGGDAFYIFEIDDGDRKLYQFSMSGLDLANASFVAAEVLATAGYNAGTPFAFRPAGDRLYIVSQAAAGMNEATIDEDDLSPAWDITGRTFSRDFDWFPDGGEMWALRFRPDGSTLFVGEPGFLFQTPLDTAWDISSANTFGAGSDRIAVGGGGFGLPTQPKDAYLSNDGATLLFLLIESGSAVLRQYTLATPGDITSWVDDEVSITLSEFSSPEYVSFDFLPDESAMVVFARGASYEVAYLYDVAAVMVPVESAHEAVIPLVVESAHEAAIPLVVESAHEAPFGLIVESAHEARIPLVVESAHEAPIRERVESAHEAVFSLMWPVESAHEAVFDLEQYTAVESAHEAGIPLVVESAHEAPVPLMTVVESAHEAVFDLRVTVESAHEAVFDLRDHNLVESAHETVFSLLSAPRTHLTMAVGLTAGSEVLDVLSWRIGADEGGYLYEGEIDVSAAGFGRVELDQAVTLDLFGEAYALVVESKRRDRSGPAGRRYVLGVRSPTVRFDFPRARPVTRTFETAVLARAAVETLLGEAVSWALVDWPIPAFRLAFEDASPIAAAQQIVQAPGGTIQTDPDGTLRIRHAYPVTTKGGYAAATPARTVDDQSQVVRSGEAFEPRRLVDRLTIRDTVEGVFRDRIVFDPDENDERAGTVRVYPSPWRTNLVVTHTSNASLQLTHLGERTREETEIVEFAAGEASVSFPIDALLAVNWLYVSLGGLSFEPYSTDLTAAQGEGYSLAEITYRTRSIDYRLVSPTVDQAQLLLQEVA